MSHAATNWAIRQRGLKPATKIVLWHLCDRHHPDMGCFPKQETLAADCEMSRSTINVHLAKLEELGLIRRDAGREEGSMKHRPTRYWLAFEDEETVSGFRTKTVSGKHEKPCPDFGENRVRIPDTNSVSEPVREEPYGSSIERAREKPPTSSPLNRRKPELPLPDTWCLSERNRSDAEKRGLSERETDHEAEQFRNYHLARDTRFRDWDAAWRTWVGNVRRFQSGGMARGANSPGGGRGRSLARIVADSRP